VLFGSKPICELSVRDMDSLAADAAFKKIWAELPQEEREKIEALRRKTQSKKTEEELDKEAELENTYYRGWLALQKLREHFTWKGFLFRVIPKDRPDAYDIFFINIQQTALVLAENYEIFKQAAEMDFHPLDVILEAEDPDSAFWKNVMSTENHLAKGLLFGFGYRNSLFGNRLFSDRSGNSDLPKEMEDTSLLTSTDVVPNGSFSFSIPIFGTVRGDETAEKYGQERVAIEQKYHNQDRVEVTLKQLFQQRAQ